jgi:stress response protein YsnF
VAEEVVVGKEAVQRTQRVSDTVRREEVVVDEDATRINAREGEASNSG